MGMSLNFPESGAVTIFGGSGVAGSLEQIERSNIKGDIGAEMAEYMASIAPLGYRPGRGEALAAAVLFMASQQASYITGQILSVDGDATL